jgi:hypothetical protein
MITSGAKALKEMAMLYRSAGSAAPPKSVIKSATRWRVFRQTVSPVLGMLGLAVQ